MSEAKLPFSVVIVTKNEEENIEAALQSAKSASEIVVIDDFSTDATLTIVRNYTDKIFQIPWQGYAKQKQAGIDRASQPWVFILDADERITPELERELSRTLEAPTHRGYYVPRKNFFLGKWIRFSGWWPEYILRLFRKDVGYMEQREVHEKIVLDGEAGHLRSPIEHYSYRDIASFIKKMNIYSLLSARELDHQGKAFTPLYLLIKPPATFLRMFFFQQGFRDGFYGLTLALLYTISTFFKYLKLWEIQKSR